jgi:hypothetical protein
MVHGFLGFARRRKRPLDLQTWHSSIPTILDTIIMPLYYIGEAIFRKYSNDRTAMRMFLLA